MENTRELVLDTLLTLEKTDDFSHLVIRSVLDKYDYLDSRDKAFYKRVCEGTIERKIELDYYLNTLSKVPVHKMKPLIRCLLRMSAYQILYMDAVPDSAVCNEAVKLAGKRKFTNLKGFVNGVLRNLSKQKGSLTLPDETKNPVAFLSVKYSMPEWIVTSFVEEYGQAATRQILEGISAVHPVCIRFSEKLTNEQVQEEKDRLIHAGISLTQGKYLPRIYFAHNAEGITDTEGFQNGYFTIQDESSALSVLLAGIAKEDCVLDVCAAPGGKSVLAAELAGEVHAFDIAQEKLVRIEENIVRMHCDNVTVEAGDATIHDTKREKTADVLILDVPCSGFGVMGKKRDIKYHVTREGLTQLETLQKEIVNACWSYVKPNGILLYSTCTLRPQENVEMVNWILENLPFSPVDITDRIPKQLQEEMQTFQKCVQKKTTDRTQACMVQLMPGFMESDGFFFAVLERKEG